MKNNENDWDIQDLFIKLLRMIIIIRKLIQKQVMDSHKK